MKTPHTHWCRWLSLAIVGAAVGMVMVAGCSGSNSKGILPDSTPSTTSSDTGLTGQAPATPGSLPEAPPPSAPSIPTDLSAPYVANTSPKLGIKSVAPSTIITAQLSEPAALDTITDQSMKVLDSSGEPIAGTVTADASGVSIAFTPSAPLINGELYTATLSTTITDVVGNALAQPYAWSFEVTPPPPPPPPPPTELPPPPPPPDAKPPFVTATNPAIGDAIATADFEKPLTVTFSEALSPASVTTTSVHVLNGTEDDVAGVVTVDAGGTVVTFTPAAPLKDSETYTVTLDTGITDVAGNPMTYAYSYNFKTNADLTIAVSAGTNFTIALKANGSVWAWGQNDFGQLGDGTQFERNHPVRVVGLDNITAISAGGQNTAMALRADGTAWAWGKNNRGQLGDGTTTNRLTPVQVKGLTDVTAIATGVSAGMALRTDGTMWTWGYGLSTGLNTTSDVLTPEQVMNPETGLPLGPVVKLGARVSALVQNDPNDPTNTTLWAWGYNTGGILGDGTVVNRLTPVKVLSPDGSGPLQEVKDISTSGIVMMALTQDGTLYTWGNNSYGGIGNPNVPVGSNSIQKLPAPIMSDVAVLQTGIMAQSIMVVKNDGTVWGWGGGASGQLGSIINNAAQIQVTPAPIGSIWNVTAITAGWSHTAFLFKDGSVKIVGSNTVGQLGDGTGLKNMKPYHFDGMPPALAVSGNVNPRSFPGKDGFYVLAKDKTVWGFGGNEYCELTLSNFAGLTVPISVPVQIAPAVLTDITQVSHGASFGLALNSDGSVLAWGKNVEGELGRNTSSAFECIPAPVLKADGTPLDKIIKISAGYSTSIALRDDNGVRTVWLWGWNGRGQLGQGTHGGYSKAAVQAQIPDGVKIVDVAVNQNSMAVADDGRLYAWGMNMGGQFGNGNLVDSYVPLLISVPPVKAVAAGAYHAIILMQDGTVMATGNNVNGSLGTESLTSPQLTYLPVQGLSNVKLIGTNGWSKYAVTEDGKLWVWGADAYGLMGQGSSATVRFPTTVPNPSGTGVIDQVVDVNYASAVTADGTTWFMGVIPEGDLVYRTTPVLVVWP